MKSIVTCVSLACFVLCARAQTARAVSPTAVAAGAEAAPQVVDLATDIARVPFAAAELLYLPMGTGEILLCPVPGISLGDGLTHLAKGLIAPFKLGIEVLRLPFNILKHTTGLFDDVPVGKL